MSGIEQLKYEARELLEEVNLSFDKSTRKDPVAYESFGQATFKERLKQLKQKAALLQEAIVYNQYQATF